MTTAVAFMRNPDTLGADPEALARYQQVVLAHAEGQDVPSHTIAEAINSIGGTRETYVKHHRAAMARYEAFKGLQQADAMQAEIVSAREEQSQAQAEADAIQATIDREYTPKLQAAMGRAIDARDRQSSLVMAQAELRHAGSFLFRGQMTDPTLAALSQDISTHEKEIADRQYELREQLPKPEAVAKQIELTEFEIRETANELKKYQDPGQQIELKNHQAALAKLTQQRDRIVECAAIIARCRGEVSELSAAKAARMAWHGDWRNMSFE